MNNKGFTLAELLAVIVIIGILIIVMFPAYVEISSSMKENSLKNMKSILVNNMLEEANKKYIDNIKPSNDICFTNNCCGYYSIDFIVANEIFQTNNNRYSLIDPTTNGRLTGYVKLTYSLDDYKLHGEFSSNFEKNKCNICLDYNVFTKRIIDCNN